MTDASPPRSKLFVYGTFRKGERNHEQLAEAEFIGAAVTAPRYRLVDLNVYPALIAGRMAVIGELYWVDRELRRKLDVLEQCPYLFQRELIELSDEQQVEAYVMRDEQVRGRRRLHVGDWKQRFAPRFGPPR
jgi:gamma-glutamylaminecyclotransferase